MRKVFLLLLLSFSINCFAQLHNKLGKKDTTVTTMANIDSTLNLLKHRNDSLIRIRENERNIQNINALVRQQKEYRDKQRRQALIRIGIGVFFLAILVIGLMRRRKK